MENDDRLIQEQLDSDEDLLNFDIDELSPDERGSELHGEAQDEETIIDLVDLIETNIDEPDFTGMEETVSSEDDILGEFEENLDALDNDTQMETFRLQGDTEHIADLEETENDMNLSDQPYGEESAAEFENQPEAGDSTMSEDELEVFLDDESTLNTALVKTLSPEDAFDTSSTEDAWEESDEEPISEALPSDEFEDAGTLEREVEPSIGAVTGISEDKLEAIITKSINDTVERVVRETVAEVAERVITEAIDALKQSLEPPAE